MTISDAIIERFREFLEDLCNKAEFVNDDRDETEWLPLSISDLRKLVNEIVSVRAKKLLHLVPVDILVRLLKVLDHQIHRAEGLSIEDCDNVRSLFNLFTLVNASCFGAHLELHYFEYELSCFNKVLYIIILFVLLSI